MSWLKFQGVRLEAGQWTDQIPGFKLDLACGSACNEVLVLVANAGVCRSMLILCCAKESMW
jgi:hypothetical protein